MLLAHDAVGERGTVIGLPDEERGQIVAAAFVVAKADRSPGTISDCDEGCKTMSRRTLRPTNIRVRSVSWRRC